MQFPRHLLQEDLVIRELVTLKYVELPVRFYTDNEKYDFWQLILVDYGEIEIFIDDKIKLSLSQGDVIFYKPHSLHGGKLMNGKSANMFIISFECSSPCMLYLEDKFFRLKEEERRILSQILREGVNEFEPPINKKPNGFPKRRAGASFGTEQLIRNYLEILIIQLIRRLESDSSERVTHSVIRERRLDQSFTAIIEFLQNNLTSNFTFSQLCDTFAVSGTQMKRLFSQKTGMGVMKYFSFMKIQHAKQLIREESANFSEIAHGLGYSGIHQFSKQFKRITNMSPSEYANSLQARSSIG